MAMVMSDSFSCVCEVVGVVVIDKRKAQAVMTMMTVDPFICIPGLKVEKVPLNAISRPRSDRKAGAISRFIIEIVNEVFGIDGSMVGAFARPLRLMRVFHYSRIVFVGSLHVEEIAVNVESLLGKTGKGQAYGP